MSHTHSKAQPPSRLPLLWATPSQNRAAGAQSRRRSSPSPSCPLGTTTFLSEQEKKRGRGGGKPQPEGSWIFLNENLNSCQPICR